MKMLALLLIGISNLYSTTFRLICPKTFEVLSSSKQAFFENSQADIMHRAKELFGSDINFYFATKRKRIIKNVYVVPKDCCAGVCKFKH
jgi:hypothetical protein